MSEIKTNADVEPCLSAVMPVYNEAATVSEVIKTVLAQRPVAQLVIVDDASTDGTWEKLQSAAKSDARVTLVRHTRNQGKGAALRTGFTHTTAPVVIIQDADLEYDPVDTYSLSSSWSRAVIIRPGTNDRSTRCRIGSVGKSTALSMGVMAGSTAELR